MDPWLGARVTGAELGATVTGAELLGTGQWPARGLGARVNGAEPPAFNPSPIFFPERSSSYFSSFLGFSLATSPYLTNRHIGP